jgi:hypothetical protein
MGLRDTVLNILQRWCWILRGTSWCWTVRLRWEENSDQSSHHSACYHIDLRPRMPSHWHTALALALQVGSKPHRQIPAFLLQCEATLFSFFKRKRSAGHAPKKGGGPAVLNRGLGGPLAIPDRGHLAEMPLCIIKGCFYCRSHCCMSHLRRCLLPWVILAAARLGIA